MSNNTNIYTPENEKSFASKLTQIEDLKEPITYIYISDSKRKIVDIQLEFFNLGYITNIISVGLSLYNIRSIGKKISPRILREVLYDDTNFGNNKDVYPPLINSDSSIVVFT